MLEIIDAIPMPCCLKLPAARLCACALCKMCPLERIRFHPASQPIAQELYYCMQTAAVFHIMRHRLQFSHP